MSKYDLVAIAGKKQTGKDTVADYLVDSHRFFKESFAAPLKNSVQRLWSFTAQQMGRDKEKIDSFWGVSPREVLQKTGTDVIRQQFSTLFPTLTCNPGGFHVAALERGLKPNTQTVISDLRFDNEYEAVKKLKGIVIRLYRITDARGAEHRYACLYRKHHSKIISTLAILQWPVLKNITYYLVTVGHRKHPVVFNNRLPTSPNGLGVVLKSSFAWGEAFVIKINHCHLQTSNLPTMRPRGLTPEDKAIYKILIDSIVVEN